MADSSKEKVEQLIQDGLVNHDAGSIRVVTVPGGLSKRRYVDNVVKEDGDGRVCIFVDDDINEHVRFGDVQNGNGDSKIFRLLLQRD